MIGQGLALDNVEYDIFDIRGAEGIREYNESGIV
jgi:hypothetical protein